MNELEEFQNERLLRVKHGIPHFRDMIVAKSDTRGPPSNPMLVISEYIRSNHMRLVDLFRALDNDSSNTITRQELKDGLTVSLILYSMGYIHWGLKHVSIVTFEKLETYGEIIMGVLS